MMFINNAMAQNANDAVNEALNSAESAQNGSGAVGTILYFVVIIFIFYLLLIRPQQKKYKEHKKLVDSVKKGDEVITIGGIIGKVKAIKEHNEIELEISKDVKISILKSSISTILTGKSNDRPNPANVNNKKKGK